jgi:hypothetical protein
MTDWHPNRETIIRLCQKLNFEYPIFMSDWEYIVVNPKRITEFLFLYQHDKDLTDNEKQTLATIIIGSFDDALLEGIFSEVVWEDTVRLFERDALLLSPILNYWACWDTEDITDCFYISQRIRELIGRLSL